MTKKSTSPAKAAQAAKASSKESSSAKNSPNASPERNSSSSSSFVKSSPSRKPAAATDPILKPALAPPPSSNGTAASAKANSSSNSSNGHANANANGHHYPLVNGSAGSSTSIVDVRAAPCSSIAATPSAASVALPPKFVDRNTFKVLQTVDGRILVEYPVRKWLSTATASSHASTSYYDPTDYLVVDTNSIFVQDRKLALPKQDRVEVAQDVHGIIGVIELCFSKYLLVITGKEFVASIQGHKVWKITRGVALPIGKMENSMMQPSNSEEEKLAKFMLDQDLLSSILAIVNAGHLYYSTTYDLTLSLQHNQLASDERKANKPVTPDDRYWFNKHLCQPMYTSGGRTDVSPWIMRIICGFVGTVELNNFNPIPEKSPLKGSTTFLTVLLSRLSRRRLGTRYVRRGLDMEGNAANSVEMEQIVFNLDYHNDKSISSFVQIRGSAPMVWRQDIDLSYAPLVHISDLKKPGVMDSIETHFKDLVSMYTTEVEHDPILEDYGSVSCVNLLNDKGHEGELTSTYEKIVETVGKSSKKKPIEYIGFPIHKWCKKHNFRNMDILMNRMKDRLVNSRCFVGVGDVPSLNVDAGAAASSSFAPGALNFGFKVLQSQNGVARVSCLDSLDRTNLTCSYFAKFMIVLQLDAMINQDEPHAGKFSGLSIPVDSVMKPYDMNATNWIRNILEDQPLTTSSSSSKTSSTSASSKKPNSLSYLRNLWADSGDAISILYAGTRALKADVTRTGQRDFVKGSIDDGLNSLTRYYLNNFTDGRKQDAYDLWSGKVKPDQMQHMLQTDRDLNLKTKHVKSPCITKDKGIGYFLPPFVVDKIDPLLQATKEFSNSGGMTNLGVSLPSISGILGFRSSPSSSAAVAKSKSEHLDVDGKPSTYIGFVLSAIKLYAPERVSNVIEFLFAFVSFLCVLVIVYIFKVKGQLLVNSPKLIGFEKSNSNLNLAEEANGTSSITSSKVHLVMQPLD